MTTTGVEWASTLRAPDRAPERDFREQLIRVERESKAASDELHQVVAGLARRLQIDPGLESLADALGRWETSLDDAERKDALSNAVAKLPETEKLVVALSHYEKLTSNEIAQVLELSAQEVDEIRQRAIARLRSQLGADPFPEPESPS